MVMHFDVGREKSINALEKAMMDDSHILLCTQKDPRIDEPGVEDFYTVGTISKVRQMLKLPGGSIRVLVEGVSRGRIVEVLDNESFFEAEIENFPYDPEKVVIDKAMEAAMRLVISDLEEYIELNTKVSPELSTTVTDIEDPGRLADVIASYLVLKPEDEQRILETFDIYERLEVLHGILQEEIELLKIEDKINQRVKKQISRLQKEYYLREQMKAIQRELGEDDEILTEVEEYRKKLDKIKMPKEVKDKALKELDRLTKTSPHSAEIGVIRTYLDWIVDLPWDKESKSKIDINKARRF